MDNAKPFTDESFSVVKVAGRPAPLTISIAEALKRGIVIKSWTEEDERRWSGYSSTVPNINEESHGKEASQGQAHPQGPATPGHRLGQAHAERQGQGREILLTTKGPIMPAAPKPPTGPKPPKPPKPVGEPT